jgi:hypothetical protein
MIEVLKQALEAFEIAAEGGGVNFHAYAEELRQALAELESQEPVARYCCHSCFKTSGGVILDRMIVCPDCGNKRCPKASNHALKCTNSNDPNQVGSIYTHPPQRTWIGLTDDEFNELYDRYVPITCYALLIEKVEAKLKQKNGF